MMHRAAAVKKGNTHQFYEEKHVRGKVHLTHESIKCSGGKCSPSRKGRRTKNIAWGCMFTGGRGHRGAGGACNKRLIWGRGQLESGLRKG